MNRSSNIINLHITKNAQHIALHALRACVTNDGIIAGVHHFVDLWARDSLFATFGSDTLSAKNTIETFLRFQREDGLIPYRIMRSKTSIAKYFGKPTLLARLVPNFRSHQSGGLVLDGGLINIIAAYEYAKRSGDKQFYQSHLIQFDRAMQWYERRFPDRLLSEWFQCEWADGVLKAGQTLYTNVLYWKALGDMENYTRQRFVGNLLRERLWNGKFFADWVDYKRQDYFSSHANMLAIVFGFASMSESKSILDVTKRYCLREWTLETNYPAYPFWRIPLMQYISGLTDYHNRGCLWLQPGITYSLALYKCGHKKEARKFFSKIAQQIERHNGVYEVYEKDGTPVNRPLYRSEDPFAWSSGLFLWASHILGKL
ncbi:MAG: hypothetical protein AAB481_03560 [Patescibacteria group bacterium]